MANGHIDGYQTEGAKHGVIRHNTIDVTQDQVATVAIWNGRKNTDDILVNDDLLAGGGFAAYCLRRGLLAFGDEPGWWVLADQRALHQQPLVPGALRVRRRVRRVVPPWCPE